MLDRYAGTFTTSIAALGKSRNCVSIEKDTLCYNLVQDLVNEISKTAVHSMSGFVNSTDLGLEDIF